MDLNQHTETKIYKLLRDVAIACNLGLLIISSVRSSNSHPDLLVTHHQPLFQITPVLNTGLSLSTAI